MVITIGGIKGGSGKSTLATHLASLFAGNGQRTILLDADKQATSSDFHQLRATRSDLASFTCVQRLGPGVLGAARDLAAMYDVVVIDAGGHDSPAQRAALLASDVAWFPVVPQPFDLWTMEPLMGLLAEIRELNPQLRAYSYLNRVDHRSRFASMTRAALTEYNAFGLLFSGIEVARRAAFATASGYGMAVHELRPADAKAVQEMDHLFAAVKASANSTQTPPKEPENARIPAANHETHAATQQAQADAR